MDELIPIPSRVGESDLKRRLAEDLATRAGYLSGSLAPHRARPCRAVWLLHLPADLALRDHGGMDVQSAAPARSA